MKALRGTPPVSSSFCGCRPSLTCGCLTPVSASVFTSPSSRSLSCLKPSSSLLRSLSLDLCVSHSVVSNSLQPRGVKPTRLLCPWDSPGKNIGAGCHALLQGIFPTQQSNPGLPHCRQILYRLSHQESPGNPLKWMGHLPPFTQSYTGPPAAPPRPLHKLLLTKPSVSVPPSAHCWSPLGDTASLVPQALPATFIPGPPTSRGCPLHSPLDMLSPTCLGSRLPQNPWNSPSHLHSPQMPFPLHFLPGLHLLGFSSSLLRFHHPQPHFPWWLRW